MCYLPGRIIRFSTFVVLGYPLRIHLAIGTLGFWLRVYISIATTSPWKRWVKWKSTASHPTNVLSPKLFLSSARQSILDCDCSFILAARIREKARSKIGSYDGCLRIEDRELRETCIRWRRGIWGACVHVNCPGCMNPFRTSHAATCKLIPEGSGGIKLSDIESLHSEWLQLGVPQSVLRGVGPLEVAFKNKDWSVVRVLFSVLADVLNIDWLGCVVVNVCSVSENEESDAS